MWLGDAADASSSVVHGDQDDAIEVGRSPCLVAYPSALDMGVVRQGEVKTQAVSLRNTCAETVALTGVLMSGSAAFTLELEGVAWVATIVTATEGVALQEPVLIEAGQEFVAPVTFSPTHGEGAYANIVWVSDDPFGGFGLAAQVKANTALPCLVTFPKSLDFAGTLVGESSERPILLKSCGAAPLSLEALSFTGPDFARFGWLADSEPFAGALMPGEVRHLTLTYSPTETATVGDTGLPVLEAALMVIESDAFKGDWIIPVSGFGAEEPCPHAIIAPGTPSEAPPESGLIFDGKLSYGVAAPVVSWEWSVEPPPGALVTLEPVDGPAVMQLMPQALGRHTVSLSVTDEKGMEACAPAVHVVDFVEVTGLAVELWWDGGNDLDIHLLHELAVGLDLDGDGQFDGWFDKPFDTFWANPNPNWGVVEGQGDSDDPSLAFDDYDGWGPERIVLSMPEEARSYRVGVHHWDDRDNGPVSAWVRVWHDGALVHEASLEAMPEHALWDLGSVAPDGQWISPGETPVVLLDVVRPVELKGP